MVPKEKNIAEIIPAAKLPRDLMQSFSYKIPDSLKKEIAVGDIVRIPFRKKEILGAVKSFQREEAVKFELKEIKNIEKNLGFSSGQMEIANFISEYYFAPISLVIKIMLPEITKQESRKEINLNSSCQIENPEETLRKQIVDAIQKENRLLLIHSMQSEKHEIYKDIIEKQKSQTLLMLPEYFDIYNFANFYIEVFGREKVAILCSDITKNQYWQEWQKIRSGQAKIIISTRQGVFAPFQNLKLIIVDEEQNSSYKQWDQNPRYDGVQVAIKLAKIYKAKIILSSPVPSSETFYKAEDSFAKISISQKFKKSPKIIDLSTERKKGNYSFISEELQTMLFEKIYAKKQALIFIPRLGEKTIQQCKDCGHIAECDTCHNALVSYRNKLYCSRCKQLYEALKSCPKCQGQNFSSFGAGSERIFKEIETLFDGKNIRAVELDSASESSNKQKKVYEDFQKGKIDILIGTQMIWKDWQMKNLELIGIIFPEVIFNIPGFRSKEKAWQFLTKTYSFAQNKTVIIETYKPDHKYFKEIRNQSTENFLQEELKNRDSGLYKIAYPPFGKLIKLIYKNPDARICEKEAKWQYEILKREIFNLNLQNSFEIIPPFPAQSFREYGKYRWHIIIKYQNRTELEIRNKVLNCVGKDWIVDIDPDEIL